MQWRDMRCVCHVLIYRSHYWCVDLSFTSPWFCVLWLPYISKDTHSHTRLRMQNKHDLVFWKCEVVNIIYVTTDMLCVAVLKCSKRTSSLQIYRNLNIQVCTPSSVSHPITSSVARMQLFLSSRFPATIMNAETQLLSVLSRHWYTVVIDFIIYEFT